MRGLRLGRPVYALGHLGLGVGLAWLATFRRRDPIDFRPVLLGAILPDLIDKPLAALLGLEARLWAHGLLFLSVLLGLGRVPFLRPLFWIGFGVASHLLLDQIWQQPVVVLWPLLGPFPRDAPSLEGLLWILLHDPFVQAGEVLGFVVLAVFAWAHDLRSRSAVLRFLRRGLLPAGSP